MQPVDSSNLDDALVALLSGDATLQGLLPGGVVFDLAPQGVTKFVLLSLLSHDDHLALTNDLDNASLYERAIYLVKAVDQNTSGTTVRQAAQRIHVLLHGNVDLSVTGYVVMEAERLERVRYTELDQATGLRWQHRGGQYEFHVTPRAA